MNIKEKEFIEEYITKLEHFFDNNYSYFNDYDGDVYILIREISSVLMNIVPSIDERLSWRSGCEEEDARIVSQKLKLHLIENNGNNHKITPESDKKIIFISHKSSDKKYGDALRDFIIGLGVNNNQLIYTSHPLHKIPMDKNIYDYLRENINSEIFMIILWSDDYLLSPACLNEMGAAWVTQSDYTNIYVPNFSFGNPKYHECAVDTQKMGAVLNGDSNCKASLIELKNKIQFLFALKDDEQKTVYLIDRFIKSITED